MADGVFNIAKGSFVEKFRDAAANGIIMLLKTVESFDALVDRTTLTDVLAGNTEANFTNYARKTGLTGTITIDNTNNRVDVDIPDQTWSAAGGAVNNTTAKVVVPYQESAAD